MPATTLDVKQTGNTKAYVIEKVEECKRNAGYEKSSHEGSTPEDVRLVFMLYDRVIRFFIFGIPAKEAACDKGHWSCYNVFGRASATTTSLQWIPVRMITALKK